MATKKQAHDWDVRLVKALSRRGELDRDAYKAYLAALPDEAEEGDQTDTRFATPYADRKASEVDETEANTDDAS